MLATNLVSRAFRCVSTDLLRLVGWASLQHTSRCDATNIIASDDCVHRNDLKTTQHTCWGVPLICNYKMSNTIVIEKRPLGRLTPYLGNARTHSDEQITQIAASIAEFGFINPILIGDDGVIIAGHGLVAAAKSLGMIEVPVIVLDHLTEAQRRALVIADNRIARTPVGMRTCCVPNSRRYATKISTFGWLGLPKQSLESYSTASTLMQVPRAHRQSPIRRRNFNVVDARRTLRNSALLGPQCTRRLVVGPQACLARPWEIPKPLLSTFGKEPKQLQKISIAVLVARKAG
jgi:hypothetical protein